MNKIKMVVFDMAGTTVRDQNEVEKCFVEAAESTGLTYNRAEIISMMGWSKRLVFETLWKKALPNADNQVLTEKIDGSYLRFKEVLENHYRTAAVVPAEGALEIFSFLRSNGIKIGLTTGFYREVTDIILSRLGWDKGLDELYKGDETSIIDVSVTSDQVAAGRPAPEMILRAMQLCGIEDPKQVINIGDTPSDIESGNNAKCLLSLGVTNGTHTREQLEKCNHNGLLDSVTELSDLVRTLI